MKRNTRIMLLAALSVLISCIAFCGIAFASHIQSPGEGEKIYGVNPITIKVKAGYEASNRQTYMYIRVKDESGTIVFNQDFSYKGFSTIVEALFVPEKTGKYTVESDNYVLIDGFKSNVDRKDSISFEICDSSSIKSLKPQYILTTNYNGNVVIDFIDDGSTGHVVYRATSKDGKYTKVGKTTKSSYTDKGLGQKTYYYKVKAYLKTGDKTVYSKYSGISSINCKASSYKVQFSLKNTDTGVEITCADAIGCTYKYYRATSKDGEYKLLKSSSKNSYIDTSSKLGKTYYYKVLAYVKVGDNKVKGKMSNIKKIKYEETIPANATAYTLKDGETITITGLIFENDVYVTGKGSITFEYCEFMGKIYMVGAGVSITTNYTDTFHQGNEILKK